MYSQIWYDSIGMTQNNSVWIITYLNKKKSIGLESS